jgi:hypothetical protein
MSFGASYLAVSSETAYNYRFQAKKALSAWVSNTTYQTLDFGDEISDVNSNYSPSTYTYTFPNNTSDQGTLVSFKVSIPLQISNPAISSNIFYLQIHKNGVALPLTDAASSNDQTTSIRAVNISFPSPTITATTQPTNFSSGDQITVKYKVGVSGTANQVRIKATDLGYSTIFSNTQTYVTTNFITSSYWSIGTWSTNPLTEYSVLTASKALTGLYSDQYTQLMPTASTAFGFSTITQPFQP